MKGENIFFYISKNLRPVEFELSLIHQSRVIKGSSCSGVNKKKKNSSPFELMVESSSLENSYHSPKKERNSLEFM